MATQFTIYRSSDQNAPVLDGQTGSLVNVLDACLVNGYTASVTSITRAGATATVTTASAHNLFTGNQVTIAGANEVDYNGTFTITSTGLTTFTYTVGGTPASPATGVITWKKLAAGWTKEFSAASRAVYRAPTGNRLYLRVQDDGPGAGSFREARLTGYETMSDVNTGLGPMPTAAQGVGGIAMVVCRKSSALSATARDWIVVADERTVYFWCITGDSAATYYGWIFGEIFSFKANDPWRTIIIGRNIENNATNNAECTAQMSLSMGAAAPAMFIARGHTELGGSVNIGRHSDSAKSGTPSSLPRKMTGAIAFTNPEDGIIYLGQVWVVDPTTIPVKGLRGRMRGFWWLAHPITSVNDGDVCSGIGSGELTGKSFLFIKTVPNGDAIGGLDGVITIETSNTLETN